MGIIDFFVLYIGVFAMQQAIRAATRVIDLGDGRTVTVRSSMGPRLPSLADEDMWIAAGGDQTFEEWWASRGPLDRSPRLT